MLPLHDSQPASKPVQALLAREALLLGRRLSGLAGGQGLLLDASMLAPPEARVLWLHLRCGTDGNFVGSPAAREDALPLATDSIDVVLLRHALECARSPARVLDEALRVLAPGGALLIAGVSPWSPWRAWLAHHARRDGQAWHALAPGRFDHRLATLGFQVDSIERFGSIWPGHAVSPGDGGMLSAGYLLSARKQRANLTLVGRVDQRERRRGAVPTLAGAAQRLRA